MNNHCNDKRIITMRVDDTSVESSTDLIMEWSAKNESKYVCVANVHMCMETYDDSEFREMVNNADLVVPDGKPLAVGLKMLGCNNCQQVRGADLTRMIFQQADMNNRVIGLYGGTPDAIKKITEIISLEYPSIKVGCAISPPYRELSDDEDAYFISVINKAQVDILLVGLGCPKQEKWMAMHKDRVEAVMVGVGAVFDFLSGTKKEAPHFLQVLGLEWLFRLLSEPGRLWKRYAVHNPRFIWYFSKQIIKGQ